MGPGGPGYPVDPSRPRSPIGPAPAAAACQALPTGGHPARDLRREAKARSRGRARRFLVAAKVRRAARRGVCCGRVPRAGKSALSSVLCACAPPRARTWRPRGAKGAWRASDGVACRDGAPQSDPPARKAPRAEPLPRAALAQKASAPLTQTCHETPTPPPHPPQPGSNMLGPSLIHFEGDEGPRTQTAPARKAPRP